MEPVYRNDDVTVYHGDALAVLPTLAAGSIDAVVTDPPYGTKVERDGYGRRHLYHGTNHIEGDDDLSLVESLLGAAPRLLKSEGWLAMFCSPKRRFDTESLCRAAGFSVRGEVVWDKRSPGLGGGIRYQHETILLCSKGTPGGRDALFSVIGEYDRERLGGHPHAKPVRLLNSLIRYCSRPGDVVLDPFAGSGTTAVACQKTGRRCILIEKDERYIDTIIRRVKDAETPLFAGLGK